MDSIDVVTSRSWDERLSYSKGLREQVPRKSHGEWTPRRKRRDPIAIIEQSNIGRIPDRVPVRNGLMMRSPLDARARGVRIDIGHGMGSFSFAIARTMLANGFPPDCISSDVHALCIEGPAFDLLTTMSKFLCLRMPLVDVIQRATTAPARALNRPSLGTLAPGAAGDASILRHERGSFPYVDSVGERVVGDQRLVASGVVLGGDYFDCFGAQ